MGIPIPKCLNDVSRYLCKDKLKNKVAHKDVLVNAM